MIRVKLSCGASTMAAIGIKNATDHPHLSALTLAHELIGCAACNPDGNYFGGTGEVIPVLHDAITRLVACDAVNPDGQPFGGAGTGLIYELATASFGRRYPVILTFPVGCIVALWRLLRGREVFREESGK